MALAHISKKAEIGSGDDEEMTFEELLALVAKEKNSAVIISKS